MRSARRYSIFLILACLLGLTLAAPIKIPFDKKVEPKTIVSKPETSFFAFQSANPDNMTVSTISGTTYFGNVTIGSNNLTFPVIYDTGSPLIWVVGPNVAGYNVTFNCTESQTCIETDLVQPLPYGSGNISGPLVIDNLWIGNIESENQFLVESNSVSGFPQDISGLIGFGNTYTQDSLYNAQGIPFMSVPLLNNLYFNGAISSRTFSVFLFPDYNYNINPDDQIYRNAGELIIDGYEPAYMAYDDFTFFPIIEPDYWFLPLNGAKFGDLTLTVTEGSDPSSDEFLNTTLSPNRILLDTGTGGLLLPTKYQKPMLDYLINNVGLDCIYENSQTLCGCYSAQNIPDMYYTILNTTLNVSSSNFVQYFNETCNLVIYYMDLVDDNWILGDPFFRQYYVYYDMDNQMAGIVESNPNPSLNPIPAPIPYPTPAPIPTPTPTPTDSSSTSGGQFFLGGLLIGVIGASIVCILKNKSKPKYGLTGESFR
jgi:hypothetical protein